MMAEKQKRFSNKINIKNKSAGFEYEFLDKFIAGIALTGTEIKSIREGKVNLQDAFCAFQDHELWVRQMRISPYKSGSHYNHDATRLRKLLLNKKELQKLQKAKEEKGLTIVPTRLFINDRGLAKLEIALARGKKLHDKRETLRQKDLDREIKRMQP